MSFNDNQFWKACVKRKQVKSSIKRKHDISTQRPLELIHLDLFGPIETKSIGGKRYGLVIVDDFTIWTWINFLKHKDESLKFLCKIFKQVQNVYCSHYVINNGEFENEIFLAFCENHGIDHNFSTPRIPQQNAFVERKNRSL